MKQIAVVTGASSGIGSEIVKQLLDEGLTVYGCARRIDRMKELEALGAKILYLDLTNEESIGDVVTTITNEEGSIDILINNAGYGLYGAVEDVALEDARKEFEVNLFGLAKLVQLVLPGMRKKRFGKIVNVSSVAGKMYSPFGAWYNASKFALEGFSDCLRLETKPFGIDVIIIEPGTISTEFDSIAFDSLLKNSGKGVYGSFVRNAAKLMRDSFTTKKSGQPIVVAKKIRKAIKSKRPKTRYAVGHRSKLALFSRKYFSDRFLDRMILRILQRE